MLSLLLYTPSRLNANIQVSIIGEHHRCCPVRILGSLLLDTHPALNANT